MIVIYSILLVLFQYDRMSELYLFGIWGGFVTKHYFLIDGEYEFWIGFEWIYGDVIKGFQNRN